MIKFWIEKRNLSWLRLVGILVVTSFLFSSLSAPFVEASFWQERRSLTDLFQLNKIGMLSAFALPSVLF